MIAYRDVSFAYAGRDAAIPALVGVNLSVAPGELVVVLGRNGSGKSTLARMANGLLLPTMGSVSVDTMATTDEETLWDVRSRVGVVLQNPENQIISTFVEEDVAFGPENLGVERGEIRKRVTASLAAVGLVGMERREPHTLSGGQKQRLAIASALALDPAYLVLDEPTAMLDPVGRAGVLSIVSELRAQGRGILHITHHLADAAKADKVVVLERGRVALEGDAEEFFSSGDRLSELGLTMPSVGKLASHLRELGIPVPAATVDAPAMLEALWHSS